MKGADGKPLRILEKIAAHDYITFGMYLLVDENGEQVDLIKKEHFSIGAGHEYVTRAIIQRWLANGDEATRTYHHLIECLRQSELGALADQVIAANTTSEQGIQCCIMI